MTIKIAPTQMAASSSVSDLTRDTKNNDKAQQQQQQQQQKQPEQQERGRLQRQRGRPTSTTMTSSNLSSTKITPTLTKPTIMSTSTTTIATPTKKSFKLNKKKNQKAWILLLVFSMFVFFYIVLITKRLSSSSPSHEDHRNFHLEQFLNFSATTTTTTTTTTIIADNIHNINDQQKDKNNNDNPKPSTIRRNTQQSKLDNNHNSHHVSYYNDITIDPYYIINIPPSDGTNLWDEDHDNNNNNYDDQSNGNINIPIPSWAKAYFNWHKYKRTTWDLANYTSERWLIMQCLADQDKNRCGGTADRLKPLPFMIRMAYNTRRILLIRWTRPAMLEEFLVPPKGGFDWRVPQEMATIMANVSNGKRLVPSQIIERYALGEMSLIRTRYQSFNGGSKWYDNQTMAIRTFTTNITNNYNNNVMADATKEQDKNNLITTRMTQQQQEQQQQQHEEEPKFDDIFYKFWRIFFRPSRPVEQRIQEELTRMKLIPGQYSSAHLRALYAISDREESQIQEWTINALNCASNLRPGGAPIFFASDSEKSSTFAKLYIQSKAKEQLEQQQEDASAGSSSLSSSSSSLVRVETHTPNPNPPLHLDRCQDWAKRPPSDFYDTFVDLYLIALAGCVTFNKGGYGHWGLLIGGNPKCFIDQATTQGGTIKNKCTWHQPDNTNNNNNANPENTGKNQGLEQKSQDVSSFLSKPLFLEPME